MKRNPGRLKVTRQVSLDQEKVAAGTRVEGSGNDDDLVSLRSRALRTPLDTMAVFADLVASRDVSEEQRQLYATRLRRESRRLSGLIDNALELQDLEAGRKALDLGPVDVSAIIRRAALASAEDNFPIEIQTPKSLPLVWADAEAILAVLANFLENARRFSLGGGPVTISAALVGDMVEISVQDHGVGLAAAELEKVFLKFYRAENGLRMRGPGAGIGLAINRSIVESHGGHVAATSGGPGKGARFHFTLPLAPDLTKSDYVLIIDGDAAYARLLKAELVSAGLETLRVSDTETAHQVLMATSPRAIVLDLRYAGLPGTDLLSRLRPDRSGQMPVVVLAAEDVPSTDMSTLETWGMLDVLPKEAGAPQAAAALIAEALAR